MRRVVEDLQRGDVVTPLVKGGGNVAPLVVEYLTGDGGRVKVHGVRSQRRAGSR